MRWLRDIREQPWRITIAAVGGLLVAIIAVGVAGLLLNQNLEQVTDEALRYDVQLEDEGDDLRAAVLDLRHYQRNITFGGSSRGDIKAFENAYKRLEEEIDELENIGVSDPKAPQPGEIRAMAEAYYEDFRPAINLYEEDQEDGGKAFVEASDRGLEQIGKMAQAGEELDELGESLTEDSVRKVDRAAATARIVLLSIIGGLLLAGAALAYAAVHVVNELRRLYAEQQATSEKLAEASRAKTDFIADVSHELRTPLTVIRGNAQLGKQLGRDSEHEEILNEIVKESGRMTRMVEDLLFLARSDSAELPLEPEPVPAASLVAEVAGRAGALARERGAELKVELSGDDEELVVDPRRIEQAVLILVDNAAKYGPPGGSVRLTSTTNSRELRITVTDDGPGIPEKELKHIFERFYRIDKTRSRKLGGAGLGLPIAKTIVEAHDGRIEATSRVGEGTSVSIYLPLEQESFPPLPASIAEQNPMRLGKANHRD